MCIDPDARIAPLKTIKTPTTRGSNGRYEEIGIEGNGGDDDGDGGLKEESLGQNEITFIISQVAVFKVEGDTGTYVGLARS